MTDVEAQVLRDNRQKCGSDSPCRHPKLELETSECADLTGNYHCTECGAPIAAKEFAEKLHPTESN